MSTREVTLDGGSPWGFRMHGGADSQQPLRIARVNPGSKASQRGIREGDLISSINGQSTRAITNSEAHALLKNAGDTLILGLNQETNGSPKRRVHKVVYGSREEISKGTNITSTSSTESNITTINRTITNSQQSNETTHTNGVGDHHKSEGSNSESSNFTSYIKNGTPCTTPRGATDSQSRDGPNDDNGVTHNRSIRSNESDIVDDSVIAATRDKPLLAAVIMPDNVCGSSRSRSKRKSRSHRKKAKKCTAVSPQTPPETELKTNGKDCNEINNETKVNELSASATTPASAVTHSATEQNVIGHEVDSNKRIESKITINNATESTVEEQSVSDYKVEFPVATPVKKKTNNNNMVKSRSLDDDEKVKITELTDEELGSVVSESTAIVSEAESDVEWEVVADLAMKKENLRQQFGKMSVISLPLEEHVSYVSPEDERSLRDFLEGLDLVSSPEESVKRIEKPSTPEAVKTKRAKKRAALAQHFMPYFENPRYLDVISEEGSDLSDRDSKQQSASYRCHVADNIDDDDVFEDIQTKLQNKFQTYYAGLNDGGAILVGTKLIDHSAPPLKEATWSTSMTETASGAEVVYLDDSSESMTPSDLLELEDNTADLDADDEEDISVDLEKSCSDSLDTSFIKSDNMVASSSNMTSRDDHLTHDEGIKSESPHKMSPPILNAFTNDSTMESSEPVNTIDLYSNALSEKKENELQNTVEDITCNQNKIINNDNNIKDYEKFSESEEELNKELKNMFECWDRLEPEYKTNEIDAAANTSRSNSASSARSSRSTSQCTAVYNPLHSSLTNIAAALRESTEDEPGEEPAPLREICVRTLLALPFGKDIIEELANVSLGIEEMTCRTPSPLESQILLTNSEPKHKSSPTTHCDKSDTDNTSVLLADNPIVHDTSLAMERDREHWIGMPTEENPNLVVCLSPSQKEFIDKTKSFPNEADSLLDLHRKYIERRGYHEDYEHVPLLTTNKDTTAIPSFKIKLESINNNDSRINYHDYIKKFTQEIPIQIMKSDNSNHEQVKNGNLRYDKYIKQVTREVPIQVEKQINKPVNNKIYSAALSDEINEKYAGTSSNQRLRAQHLGEWLNLARNESDRINILNEHARKVHNLHSSVNKLVSQRSCEDRPPNSMEPQFTQDASARRYSLPFILYEQQMEYILEKEREIEQEIEKLKQEKSKLENNHSSHPTLNPSLILTDIYQPPKQFNAANYQISRKGDIAILNSETPKLSPKNNATNMATEKFRQQMYNEYLCKIAERQERKHNKVLKIQISPKIKSDDTNQSSGMSPQYEVKHVCGIEDEFMNKVREKKLGGDESKNDDDTTACNLPPVKIMDGSSVKETSQLPKHLQEFVDYRTSASTIDDGIWSPGKGGENTPVILQAPPQKRPSPPKDLKCNEPTPVVWTPRSAGSSPTADRKEFRPVTFESPVLSRKNPSKEPTPVTTPDLAIPIPPPWQGGQTLSSSNQETVTSSSTITTSLEQRKLTTSHSAPIAGLNSLGKLPRAQNPTITLLQKAREGQLPRGASYIDDPQPQQNGQKPRTKDGKPPLISPGEILYTVKNEYMSESDSEKPKKMADLGPRKFEGIGPTTKDGMPIVLRSEVKDSNQAKWYKRMYDTLHRAKPDDEYVTVRYKTRRGRYPYTSAAGYLSEPEPNAYDSDAGISASKYATLDRRRMQPTKDKENEYITYTVPRNKYASSASVKHATDVYKNQPGRIENYVPGHSSISEKEAKEWWDEVMEIFDGHLEQQKHVPPSRSYMNHALKESGYESDSTLVFRRREDAALQLSPLEQKEAYKTIQKGGEVPLHGLRKLAPERPKESPRKYVEDEVTIHYRSPVRHEIKEALSEEELARRQAEAMRRIYQEERRRKYLQELQDMNSRRHTDNFIPSQKSPIPLNRYDDFVDDLSPKIKLRDRSPEPRLVARALYNFVGQSSRELTFRKGDVIFIRRQVDKNWYEGEHNAMVGLFPTNYVEIVPYDGIKTTPRKANEGQARAKFNFIAQTHLELSLAKGELVVLTRRVDDNWFEGRIGNRKGIFPVSYVEVLIDPSEKQDITLSISKPVASPAAHSMLLNGSAGGKESMGSHHYQPSYTSQTNATSYHAKPINVIGTATSYSSITRSQKITTGPAVNEALHIDTHSEPVPYRALYKYRPQNEDELELQEGDTVFVLEKCDDGWYVGSSQRTGAFGTFPGNYVERI